MHPQKLYLLYVLGKDENTEGKKKGKLSLVSKMSLFFIFQQLYFEDLQSTNLEEMRFSKICW